MAVDMAVDSTHGAEEELSPDELKHLAVRLRRQGALDEALRALEDRATLLQAHADDPETKQVGFLVADACIEFAMVRMPFAKVG